MPSAVLIGRGLRVGHGLGGRRATFVQAPDAVRRARMFLLANQPAGRVERMHAGVAEIAGAVLPEEVPVVMEVILVEWSQRRRSQPQVVVHPGRRRAVGDHADRIAAAIDDRLACVNLPESAIPQELDGLAEQRPAAALRAGLHDAVVAACRVDHAPPFDDVVADRLFAVDILAGLARHDGDQRVPVIRRGVVHGIDVTIVEHAPEIRLRPLIAAPSSLGKCQRRREVRSSTSTRWVMRTFLMPERCS